MSCKSSSEAKGVFGLGANAFKIMLVITSRVALVVRQVSVWVPLAAFVVDAALLVGSMIFLYHTYVRVHMQRS